MMQADWVADWVKPSYVQVARKASENARHAWHSPDCFRCVQTVDTCPGMQIYNQHQVATEPSHAKFTHELLLLFVRIHAQKAQRLTLAFLAGGQDIQPGNRAEAGTDREQRRPQGTNIRATL